MEDIKSHAFDGDTKLMYIICYVIEPPLLDESAFVNYDAHLSVPCESQADYKVSKGWKLFNKENVNCIGAEETPIATDGYTDLLPLPYEGKDGIGSVKFIHNGRLLIERNGILYNAHGARVK